MPTLDPVKNFGKADLTAGINNSATTLTIATGDVARFPDPGSAGHFNVTIYNSTDYSDPADDPNREILRMTALSTATYTITRAQEGTSAANHNTGGKTYTIILSMTKKMIDDIQAGISSGKIVHQVAHGLNEGDLIKSNGTDFEYDLAVGDNAADAEVVGIVTSVVDVDNFVYSRDIAGYTGAQIPTGTPGVGIFLDQSTPGAMTLTPDTSTTGLIVKPVGVLTASGAEMDFSASYLGLINP